MEAGSAGAGAPAEWLGSVLGVPSSLPYLARLEVPVVRVAVGRKGGLAVTRKAILAGLPSGSLCLRPLPALKYKILRIEPVFL